MAFPSTFVDIQNAVINKVRLDATADLAKVKDWINQVYAEVAVVTEFKQATATVTLSAGTSIYTIPSTVIQMKQLIIQPAGTTSYGPPLVHISIEDLLTRRQNTDSATNTGKPTHYMSYGQDRIELWPTPGAADTLTYYHTALPTALSANSDVPAIPEPFASKLLEYGALAEAADFLKDPYVDNYRALFESWLARYQAHLTRRRGAMTQAFRLVGYSPWLPHDNSVDVR